MKTTTLSFDCEAADVLQKVVLRMDPLLAAARLRHTLESHGGACSDGGAYAVLDGEIIAVRIHGLGHDDAILEAANIVANLLGDMP